MQWCMKQTVEKDQLLYSFLFSQICRKICFFCGLCAVVPMSRFHFLHQSQLDLVVVRSSHGIERRKLPFLWFYLTNSGKVTFETRTVPTRNDYNKRPICLLGQRKG